MTGFFSFFFFLLNRVRGNIVLDWKFCSWHSHCWMDLLLNVLWLELLVFFFLYFHSTIVCCVESVSCLLLFQSLLLQTRYLIVRPVLSKFDLWHRILQPVWMLVFRPRIWHWHWISPIPLYGWSWYSQVETSSKTPPARACPRYRGLLLRIH